MLFRIMFLHGTVSLHANFMALSLFEVPLMFRYMIWLICTADVYNKRKEKTLGIRLIYIYCRGCKRIHFRIQEVNCDFSFYLVLTSIRGVTVELVNNNGIWNIFHPHILVTHGTNITWSSLHQTARKRGIFVILSLDTGFVWNELWVAVVSGKNDQSWADCHILIAKNLQ